jgi:hypothetical protein
MWGISKASRLEPFRQGTLPPFLRYCDPSCLDARRAEKRWLSAQLIVPARAQSSMLFAIRRGASRTSRPISERTDRTSSGAQQ